jgi:hypothetical protein
MSKDEYQEFQAYKATGLSPAEISALRQGVYPDDEDRAPLPRLSPEQIEYFKDRAEAIIREGIDLFTEAKRTDNLIPVSSPDIRYQERDSDNTPLSDPDFAYDRRLELRDEFHGADLTREDIHLGSGLLEDE